MTNEAADRIQQHIWAADKSQARGGKTFEEYVEDGQIVLIDEKTLKAFLAAIIRKRTKKKLTSGLKVVYTPLYGAGLIPVTSILKYIGIKDLQIVTEQAKPNGDFPTCPYPNPEIKEALACGLKLCETEKPDLLLATDPDCDRVGIAVPDGDHYELFTGNEVGALLLEYICKERIALGTMPKNPVAVKCVVCIPL